MKTVPFGIAGLAVLASGLLGFSPSARAQDEPPQPIPSRAIAATVDYGNNNLFALDKSSTDFTPLGLLPQQLLSITVQFPIELAGQAMIVEAPDGGTVFVPEGGIIVGSDGNVTFQFQAGNAFGACRIVVHQPDDSNFLQLWNGYAFQPGQHPCRRLRL
jgi:hypothetical protein